MDGVSPDAVARCRHGWVALFWSGPFQSEDWTASRLGRLAQDLRDLAIPLEAPWPGLLAFVVNDEWQRELVYRASRSTSVAPGVGAGSAGWKASPWVEKRGQARGRALDVISQGPSATLALVRQALDQSSRGRAAQNAGRTLHDLGLIDRLWQGGKRRYRSAHLLVRSKSQVYSGATNGSRTDRGRFTPAQTTGQRPGRIAPPPPWPSSSQRRREPPWGLGPHCRWPPPPWPPPAACPRRRWWRRPPRLPVGAVHHRLAVVGLLEVPPGGPTSGARLEAGLPSSTKVRQPLGRFSCISTTFRPTYSTKMMTAMRARPTRPETWLRPPPPCRRDLAGAGGSANPSAGFAGSSMICAATPREMVVREGRTLPLAAFCLLQRPISCP